MADEARFEPESSQIVSDLGQLRLFANPVKMRILRILQSREATISQLSGLVDEPAEAVSRHINELAGGRIVKLVDRQVRDGRIMDVYRATALIFQLRPDPAEISTPATSFSFSTVAAASIDSVASELVTSVETWPNQRMNCEGRRARITYARAEEFNEKLVQLIDDYWGSPGMPFEGNPGDPLLAFVGFWYRFPDDH